MGDGSLKSIMQLHLRHPIVATQSQFNIWLSLFRVIVGKGFKGNHGGAACYFDHVSCHFQYGKFVRISHV